MQTGAGARALPPARVCGKAWGPLGRACVRVGWPADGRARAGREWRRDAGSIEQQQARAAAARLAVGAQAERLESDLPAKRKPGQNARARRQAAG